MVSMMGRGFARSELAKTRRPLRWIREFPQGAPERTWSRPTPRDGSHPKAVSHFATSDPWRRRHFAGGRGGRLLAPRRSDCRGSGSAWIVFVLGWASPGRRAGLSARELHPGPESARRRAPPEVRRGASAVRADTRPALWSRPSRRARSSIFITCSCKSSSPPKIGPTARCPTCSRPGTTPSRTPSATSGESRGILPARRALAVVRGALGLERGIR